MKTLSRILEKMEPLFICAALLLWLPAEHPQDHVHFLGDYLFYGFHNDYIFWSMPLEPLLRTVLRELFGPGYWQWLMYATSAAMFALVYSLAWLAGGRRPGLAGLVFLGAAGGFIQRAVYLLPGQDFYALTLLAAGGALTLRAYSFTPGYSALAGVCIGVSLLVRSPLFLLGPAVWGWDLLRGRFASRRKAAAHAAGLVLLPALFILPWLWMNWQAAGKFIPFEGARADCNLIAGAYGLAMTTEGSTLNVAGLKDDDHITLWAVGETLKHPCRSARAWAERFLLAFSWHPGFFALFFGALFLRRSLARPGPLLFLISCFTLVHILSMPVEERYFVPLWPLCLAAGLALFCAAGPKTQRGAPSAPLAVFRVSAAVLLALALATEGFVLAYPARQEKATARVLSLNPESSAVQAQLERQERWSGNRAGALKHAARAMALCPQDNRRRQLYLFGLMDAGIDASGPLRHGPDSTGQFLTGRYELLRMLQALLNGNTLEAEKRLAIADNYWKGGEIFLRRAVTPYEKAFLARMLAADDSMTESELYFFVARLSPEKRLAALRGLGRIGVSSAKYQWLEARDDYAAETGEKPVFY
ncbi:MAG: hypothetical protein GX410_03155 [Elusimicrobia bacterium]|nr:hypothetical protein [Elusimicrobiota bacterium]